MTKEDVAGLQVVEVVSDGVWQTQPGHVTPRHPLPAHRAPDCPPVAGREAGRVASRAPEVSHRHLTVAKNRGDNREESFPAETRECNAKVP